MTQQMSGTELAFTQDFNVAEQQILSEGTVALLTDLVKEFALPCNTLLVARADWQEKVDAGQLPDFLVETRAIRESEWKIRNIPSDLRDRRVEITGPVERKMVINALNANIKVCMADFEDSLAPSWEKVIDGHINLNDAVNGTISYTNEKGKTYQLKPDPAVLIACGFPDG